MRNNHARIYYRLWELCFSEGVHIAELVNSAIKQGFITREYVLKQL